MYKSTLRAAIALLCCAFGISAKAQSYCSSTSSMSCVGGTDYIDSLVLIGDASYIYSSGCNGNPDNYIYDPSQPLAVSPGSVIDAFIMPYSASGSAGVTIWVDWNMDYDFLDAGEQVYNNPSIPSGSMASPWFAVPLTASSGATRVRVRSYASGTTVTPCSSTATGETEDYLIDIGGGMFACSGMPNGGSAMSTPAAICDSGFAVLINNFCTAGSGITYQWYQAPIGSGTYTAIAGATTSVYTTYQMSGMDYYMTTTCVNSGMSANSSVVSVPVTSCDSVWPGDANADFTANYLDVFSIAMAGGATGTPRAGATTNWQAEYTTDWSTSSWIGVNDKHADCNGDGTVDTSDVAAVLLNYGLTHMRSTYTPNLYKTTSFPDLYIDASGVQMLPGTTVQIPVKFGTAATPAQNIYGVAGKIDINGITPATDPSMTFTNWMNTPATAKLSKATGSNNVDFALARMDHNNTTNNGVIGYLNMTLPATVSGPIIFHMHDMRVINKMGDVLTNYNVVDDTANTVTSVAILSDDFGTATIYPNPSAASANINLDMKQAGDVIVKITDISGRITSQQTIHAATGRQYIAMPSVATGMYMVSLLNVRTGDSKIMKWVKE